MVSRERREGRQRRAGRAAKKHCSTELNTSIPNRNSGGLRKDESEIGQFVDCRQDILDVTVDETGKFRTLSGSSSMLLVSEVILLSLR